MQKVLTSQDRALRRDDGAIQDDGIALVGAGIDANVADDTLTIGATNAGDVEIGRDGQDVKIKGNLVVEGAQTAGKNLVLDGLTTSALTTGKAAYLSAANTAAATDSANQTKSHFAGVYAGTSGELVTAGPVTAAFTTAGGAPSAGAPVYLAAAADDTNTGGGKFTATKPVAGYVSEVGICVDPAGYAGAKTAVILLQPKAVVAA